MNGVKELVQDMYEQEIQQLGVDTQQPDESSNMTNETKQPNRLSLESLRSQRSIPQIKMISNRLDQAEERITGLKTRVRNYYMKVTIKTRYNRNGDIQGLWDIVRRQNGS